MAYRNFDNARGVAAFLADIDFAIVDESQGDFTPAHVAYRCRLSVGDASFVTTYQCNPAYSGEPTVTDVVCSLASDAADAEMLSVDEFADEMGFEKPSQAIRAYDGCKSALEWFK